MKRAVQTLAAGAALVFLTAPGALAQDDAARDYEAQDLGGGLTLLSGPDGNVLVGEQADGLVVVNGGRAENADALMAAIRAETGRDDIATLIVTDWNAERIGLNERVAEAGGEVVMHFNAENWLKYGAPNRPDGVVIEPAPAALPTELVMDEGTTLPFGEDEIRIGFLQQARGDADIYAYFPGADVLAAGAVLRSDGWVEIDWAAGGYLGAMLDAHEVLLDVAGPDTVIAPGSGPTMSYADLQEQAGMYEEMFYRVSDLVLGAQSPDEAVVAHPTGEYRPEWENADAFTRHAHHSFRWRLRRDPRLDPIP